MGLREGHSPTHSSAAPELGPRLRPGGPQRTCDETRMPPCTRASTCPLGISQLLLTPLPRHPSPPARPSPETELPGCGLISVHCSQRHAVPRGHPERSSDWPEVTRRSREQALGCRTELVKETEGESRPLPGRERFLTPGHHVIGPGRRGPVSPSLSFMTSSFGWAPAQHMVTRSIPPGWARALRSRCLPASPTPTHARGPDQHVHPHLPPTPGRAASAHVGQQ